MNKWILYLALIIIQLSANAQQRRAEDYYVTAFNEMSDMLAGRDSLSIKLVDLVVNTINSKDKHKVEYLLPGKDMSLSSFNVFSSIFEAMNTTSESVSSLPNGYATIIMNLSGEAFTKLTKDGSLTIILNNPDAFVTNRPATLGHEIIGHGRSMRLGYTDDLSQHVLPIQVENLILRNMGIPLFRNGIDHGPLKSIIPNYMSLPNFR